MPLVQPDIRQERTTPRPLRRTYFRRFTPVALQDADLEPLLYQTQHLAIGYPYREHLQHQLVVNRVEEAADVRVEHAVHRLLEQQPSELRLAVPLGRVLHPLEVRRQSFPAQCPALGQFRWAPFKPAPSLRAPRCLRRHQRYYEPVRFPTSAQRIASVVPRFAPPSATIPMDPVGPPGFRERPFARDTVHDPGGATPSRGIDDAHAAFAVAKQLGLRDVKLFGATNPYPNATPVYASDHTLPDGPQHSVPGCRLWRCPGRTCTCMSLTAYPSALAKCCRPLRG